MSFENMLHRINQTDRFESVEHDVKLNLQLTR